MTTSLKSKFIKTPPLQLITDINRAMGFSHLLHLFKNIPFTIKDLQMRNVLCSVSPYLEELNTYYQEEYKKYVKTQQGGAESSESDDNKPKMDRGDFIFQIKSIDIVQDEEEHKFKGIITKSPPIKIRFHEKEVPWAKVIKAAMGFVNKNLRMKFIKKVTIKGKKTEKFDKMGDDDRIKIEGTVDLSSEPVYEEIKIIMG